MNLILPKCIEYHEDRKICVVTEKGKTYSLINNSGFKIRTIKVDKCLSQNEGEKRCDYLMDINEKEVKRAIFIELKGSSLNDAVKQLYSTIIYLKDEYKDHQLDARIVGSRDVPNLESTPDYRKLAREVKITKGNINRATNKVYKENV